MNQFDSLVTDQLDGYFDAFKTTETVKHVTPTATTLLSDAVFEQSTKDDWEYLDAAGNVIDFEALLTIKDQSIDMAKDHFLIGSDKWHPVAQDIQTATLDTFLITKRRNVNVRVVKTRRKRN